jgi:hypothetical protein
MKQTKVILKTLENNYSNIDYYNLIVDKIEKNVDNNPDISIESCKSLIEGISKFILKQLDNTYDPNKFLDLQPLFKKALASISTYNKNTEDDFTNRTCALVHLIGEIRSKRGDISHGKLAPKEFNSNSIFSKLVMDITDSLLFYVLTCFSQVQVVKVLEFKDNPEFNQWLDEENPFGNLSYSRALFDQDSVAYEQELINYKDLQETGNG